MTRIQGTGATLLFPLLFAACSSEPQIIERPVVVEKIVYRPVPVDRSLLTDYAKVPFTFETNGDLLAGFNEANARIGMCNADKAELRGLLSE